MMRRRGSRAARSFPSHVPGTSTAVFLLALASLLFGACGSASSDKPGVVSAPDVLPAGAHIVHPTPPSALDTSCGNPTASDPPPATMPAPGHMTPGSYMAHIQARGYLEVGVDDGTYLWGYRDPTTGELTGFDVDMLRQVSQAIFGSSDPRYIHFTIVPNDERIPYVQKGLVDIVAETMTVNCEREKSVDFSSVYYEAGQRILVPDDSSIRGPQDLAGSASAPRTARRRWRTSWLQACRRASRSGPCRTRPTASSCSSRVRSTPSAPMTPSCSDWPPRTRTRSWWDRHSPRAVRHGHQQRPSGLHVLRERRPGTGEGERDVGFRLQPDARAVHPRHHPGAASGDIPVSLMNPSRLETTDRRIAELRSTLERTGASLVELDTDVTRRLLDVLDVLAGDDGDSVGRRIAALCRPLAESARASVGARAHHRRAGQPAVGDRSHPLPCLPAAGRTIGAVAGGDVDRDAATHRRGRTDRRVHHRGGAGADVGRLRRGHRPGAIRRCRLGRVDRSLRPARTADHGHGGRAAYPRAPATERARPCPPRPRRRRGSGAERTRCHSPPMRRRRSSPSSGGRSSGSRTSDADISSGRTTWTRPERSWRSFRTSWNDAATRSSDTRQRYASSLRSIRAWPACRRTSRS